MVEGLALKEYPTEIQHESEVWFHVKDYIPPPDPVHYDFSIKVLTAVWTLCGWSYEMCCYNYKHGHFQRNDGLSFNVTHWNRIEGPIK